MIGRSVWLSVAAFMIVGFPAYAAKEVHEFEVSLYVPKPVFYVLPVETDWMHLNQHLEWDIVNSRLGSLRKRFDVRNDGGAIKANLLGKPVLSNSFPGQEIVLSVLFNGRVLNDVTSVEVVTPTEARMGSRVLLEIVPVKPTSGYRPGSYYGSVNIMFNADSPL